MQIVSDFLLNRQGCDGVSALGLLNERLNIREQHQYISFYDTRSLDYLPSPITVMSPRHDSDLDSSEESRLQALVSTQGKGVADCLLATSGFTIAGVAVGTFLGVRRKHLRPLVTYSLAGTAADFVYGYGVSCDPLIRELRASKEALEKLKTRED